MSNILAFRPRINIDSKHSPTEIVELIKTALAVSNEPFKGTVRDTHIILKIPLREQNYWSPQLDLDIEETTTGSLIKGRFGPRPSIWIMYIFFYSLLTFISMTIMIMGFAQMNLGMSAHILWGLYITGVTFLFLFFTAKAGQKLGQDERIRLKLFLDKSIKNY